MRILSIAIAVGLTMSLPQPTIAQVTPGSHTYTILSNFTRLTHDEWVTLVQQQIDAGYIFYVNSENVNSWGAERIVNTLGSYYMYVYGPNHHEIPAYTGSQRCEYVFNTNSSSPYYGEALLLCLPAYGAH